jgi:predicted DNA-binding transcriptional regulator YafY
MPVKKDDATPGEKLLALYTLLLFDPREFGLKELADNLKCSKPTVLRLLNQMEAARFGKLMERTEGQRRLVCLEKPEKPQLSLDADGLRQLALCRDLVLHLLPEGFRKQIGNTLLQASAYATPQGESTQAVPALALTKGRIDYAPFQEMLSEIRNAIMAKTVCAVEYQARRGEPAKSFEFAPQKLIVLHETLYAQGWWVTTRGRTEIQQGKEEPVTLPLQRFRKVERLRDSSADLPAISQDNDSFGLMEMTRAQRPIKAVIRFAPEAATYVVERIWSKKQTIRDEPDGGLRLTLQARSEPELIAWVLSFGPSAELLSPKRLRREMERRIGKMLPKYTELP